MPCGRRLVLALSSLALVYAFVAGLRTVADPDVCWQLAMGRNLVQSHAVPWHDAFSHTAAGREYIYPPFSGAVLYLVQRLGGYPALSWLGCLTCVATAALLLGGGGAAPARAASALLAMVAVPLLAERSKPRADLFSTVLIAAVLVILWRHFQRRRSPLWLLPVIMCAWANLHLGFIAGLLLIGSYVVMEAAELPWPGRRGAALAGLRAAAPWLAAGAAATLANRWGPWLYAALFRWSRLLEEIRGFLGEWFPLRLSAATARAVLDWRNPDSAYLWLALVGLLAATAAVLQKRPGPALLILGSLFGSLYWVRFQALSAMVTVVTAGDLLAGCRLQLAEGRRQKAEGSLTRSFCFLLSAFRFLSCKPAFNICAVIAALVLAAAFVGVRVADAVSNRVYLSAPDNVIFGPGVSQWYPERAARFIRYEHLPRNLLNDFNIGGYLIWALWPEYRTSIDNRVVQFGAELFHLHRRLLSEPPGSPLWRDQSERLGLNTLVVGITRYAGSTGFPLRQFCESAEWRPVYLDETAAVFVRDRPENAAWIQRLGIDCGALQFAPPATRNKGRLYHFYMDAGWTLFLLGRDREALTSLEQARTLFDADPQFYLIKGSILQAGNRLAEAEAQYRASLRLRESEQAWYAIGQALAAQGRLTQAAEAMGRAARYASFPHEIYRVLGQVYLATDRPREALDAFQRAERTSPYRALTDPQAARFRDELAAGRARAQQRLRQLKGD
jgi:tetratricopeptide (TPR) repeat protein